MTTSACQHCKAMNTYPQQMPAAAFRCHHCGQPLQAQTDPNAVIIGTGSGAAMGAILGGGLPGAIIGGLLGFIAGVTTKKR